MKKISICFLIIIMILGMFITNISYAKDLGEMMTEASDFVKAGKTGAQDVDVTEVTNEFVGIGKLLSIIGAGVMVAVTTYMGIKYLVSGPEAQGKLKQQLIGVVVSGVVVFGAYGIWKIVINIAKNFD